MSTCSAVSDHTMYKIGKECQISHYVISEQTVNMLVPKGLLINCSIDSRIPAIHIPYWNVMVLPLDDDVIKFSKLWTYVTSYYYVGSGYTYQHGVCLSVAPHWETRILHYEVWLSSCLNI